MRLPMRELVLGCGDQRKKLLTLNGSHEYENPTTLDINPICRPDVLHDLNDPHLPFNDDTFDEAHAYCVLEHTGQQGDWRFFFRQFDDFWRVLRPGGHLFGICPRADSVWAWGDPGHTRIVSVESLGYLCRPMYGAPPRTDYRPWFVGDWDLIYAQNQDEHRFGFVLQAVKPAR
jgi:hypothetical protein